MFKYLVPAKTVDYIALSTYQTYRVCEAMEHRCKEFKSIEAMVVSNHGLTVAKKRIIRPRGGE